MAFTCAYILHMYTLRTECSQWMRLVWLGAKTANEQHIVRMRAHPMQCLDLACVTLCALQALPWKHTYMHGAPHSFTHRHQLNCTRALAGGAAAADFSLAEVLREGVLRQPASSSGEVHMGSLSLSYVRVCSSWFCACCSPSVVIRSENRCPILSFDRMLKRARRV